MGSPFDAALAAADATMVATFGWPIRVTPRLKSTAKAHQPDPNRGVKEARGVFTRVPKTERLQGSRTGTQLNGMTTLSVAETELWLPAAEVARLGYEPVPPDLLTLTGRPRQPSYAITKVGPDDQGGLKLTLTVETAQ